MQSGSDSLWFRFADHIQKGRVGQGNDLFLWFAIFGSDEKLYVHGIGVTNGDSGLQPAELHLPHASERVWTRLKKAALVAHDPMLACTEEQGLNRACDRWLSERQQFVAGFFVIAESSQHGAGDCAGVLLFHSAHHHAEVPRLADDAHARAAEAVPESFRRPAGSAAPESGAGARTRPRCAEFCSGRSLSYPAGKPHASCRRTAAGGARTC